MKLITTKYLLHFVGLFLITTVSGQTLTCANTCPQAGRVYGIRTASPVIGAGGQNVLWNFSTFTDFDTKDQPYVYFPVAATPQGSLFPQASVAMKQWNGLYYYMNHANDGIRVAYPTSITVNAPEMYIPFPFSYGKTYTQTIVSSYIENLDTMVTYKYKTIACTGTGTMVLPWMTFNNTLKIETKSNWVTFKNGLVFGYVQHQTEHTYYATDFKHRIVYYRQRYEEGPSDYGPYTEIYRGDITGIETQERNALQVEIMPNPASTHISITQEQEAATQFQLYSAAGQLVLSQHAEALNSKLDVSTFPRGLYLLVIEQGQARFTKKIILE